jgi:hypothetical protein
MAGSPYDPPTFTIYRETLTLQSKEVDTTSSIRVDPGSTANAEMQYPTSSQRGTVDEWSDSSTDFEALPILIDDLARIAGLSDNAITNVSTNLTLTDEIPNNTSKGYQIINPDRESHDSFIQKLTNWRASNLAYWTELDYAANTLLHDDPRQDVIDAFVAKLATVTTNYNNLLVFIEDFEARRLVDVDDVFKVLKEGGFDRAFDLLGEAAFATFFALEAEEATYQGYFQLETETFVQENLTPDQFKDPLEDEFEEYRAPGLDSYELGDFEE